MMANQKTSCPEVAELTAFANGDLTDAKLEHLAKHIDQCESCGMIVDATTKLDDSELVAELRALKVQAADLNTTDECHANLVPAQLLKAANQTRKYANSTMATTGRNENRDATDPNRTSLSLILQATQQDPAAWERLVSIYSPLVYFWCQKSGLSRADLQDVFQEVFHALARNLHKFRPMENGTFRGWLRTLTRNKLNDHFR